MLYHHPYKDGSLIYKPRSTEAFNPSILYLKYWLTSPITQTESSYTLSLQSYAILHGAILAEESIPEENRNEIEALCRTMRRTIIERLGTIRGPVGTGVLRAVGRSIHSAYEDLINPRNNREDEDAEVCKLYSLLSST